MIRSWVSLPSGNSNALRAAIFSSTVGREKDGANAWYKSSVKSIVWSDLRISISFCPDNDPLPTRPTYLRIAFDSL